MNKIYPGDCMLIMNGEHSFLNYGINLVQRRLLKDIGMKDSLEYGVYTHCICFMNYEMFAEMYTPVARTRKFSDLDIGTKIVVKRLKNIDIDKDHKILEHALIDVSLRTPYPIKELFYYLFKARWHFLSKDIQKENLNFAQRFLVSRRSDVCSSRYIYWIKQTGLLKDQIPENWFPARIAADKEYFDFISVMKIDNNKNLVEITDQINS